MNNPALATPGGSPDNTQKGPGKNCFTCYLLSCECVDPKGCSQENNNKNDTKDTGEKQLDLFN